MAEQERLTNKERRTAARAERKRREAEAARRRKRTRIRNAAVTFVVVGIVAAVALQAFVGGPDALDEPILISASDAAAASEAAGCVTLADREPLEERYHFENNQAPDPSTIYTDVRPTHSGPHTIGVHPVTAASSRQISEVSTTHNLEHGSVIVWWDPEQVDRSTASAIGAWAETMNANGFRRDVGGVGIMSAPYDDPGISSGKAIALRAWGVAVDCDRWDETVAADFLIDHFGDRGIGPERTLAPFPPGVLVRDEANGDEDAADSAG